MATTSPDNIYSPDAGQQYALTQDLLAMADSVQAALTNFRNSDWDVGWTTLTASSGWTAGTGSNSPQLARFAGAVWFRGSFYGGTANTTCTTLPTWGRPSRTSRVLLSSDTNAFGFVRIFNGGAMQPSVSALHAENLVSWTAR